MGAATYEEVIGGEERLEVNLWTFSSTTKVVRQRAIHENKLQERSK